MISRKPMLITGSHRSGSTWVGRMLSASPSVGYIHEPFNLDWQRKHPGICNANFQHWFTYITKDNELIFYEPIKNTLAFHYNLIEELKSLKSLKDVGLMVRDYFRFFKLYNISQIKK